MPEVWAEPGRPFPAVEQRVRELFAAGRSDDEIGAALEVSARLAKKLRHALDLLRAPSPTDVVSDTEIRRLHAEGLVTREISARSGLAYRSTQERLSRLGLRANPAPRGRPPKGGRPESEPPPPARPTAAAWFAALEEAAVLAGLEDRWRSEARTAAGVRELLGELAAAVGKEP